MKFLICLPFILFACKASQNPSKDRIDAIVNGEIPDSSHVYTLPYDSGRSIRIVQGYFSNFSHRERAALDFNMKSGTRVLAAREGVVLRVKQDGKRGGLNKKYRKDGNNIVIQHTDGSRAGYWHLRNNGAVVKVGDTIKTGQLIGYSGNTGYTAFPHLHFLVWKSDANGWQQIPTRFYTSSGVEYLHFWNKYRR